jgi:hypothetical protein
MSIAPPILCQWDGESFVPLARHAKLADTHFVVGETYPLVVEEGRSGISHRHYFASISEAWHQLPEDVAERWPTPEHLRKYALIRCGYADERSIVCASKAEAQRIGAFIKPMDDYAVVLASEAVVKVYTAKSQSVRAMGGKEFQKSKTAVLDFIAGLIGVTPESLSSNAQRAA